jgi:nitroreductase
MDLELAIRKRRMFREFDGRPVSKEDVHRLLWAAGRSQQGRPGVRHMVVVDDPALIKTAKQVLPGFLAIVDPSLIIVLCSDLANPAIDAPAGREHATRLDAGAACAHLGLMARQLNLGICTVTSWSDGAVRELFDLPESFRPDVTVAVGHPVATPRMPTTKGKQFLPNIHYNTFNTPYDEVKR